MFDQVKVDRLINSSVHRKIGLLITIQVQRRNVNGTFYRVLPNRRPHGFATNRNLSRHSDIHRNQLHRTMTRRTEFTAASNRKFVSARRVHYPKNETPRQSEW